MCCWSCIFRLLFSSFFCFVVFSFPLVLSTWASRQKRVREWRVKSKTELWNIINILFVDFVFFFSLIVFAGMEATLLYGCPQCSNIGIYACEQIVPSSLTCGKIARVLDPTWILNAKIKQMKYELMFGPLLTVTDSLMSFLFPISPLRRYLCRTVSPFRCAHVLFSFQKSLGL